MIHKSNCFQSWAIEPSHYTLFFYEFLCEIKYIYFLKLLTKYVLSIKYNYFKIDGIIWKFLNFEVLKSNIKTKGEYLYFSQQTSIGQWIFIFNGKLKNNYNFIYILYYKK